MYLKCCYFHKHMLSMFYSIFLIKLLKTDGFLSQHKNISLYLRTCQSCLHGCESAVDGSLHGLEVGLQGLEAADLVIGAGHAGARDGHGDGADGGVGGVRDDHH